MEWCEKREARMELPSSRLISCPCKRRALGCDCKKL